jgi:hypothetical protein
MLCSARTQTSAKRGNPFPDRLSNFETKRDLGSAPLFLATTLETTDLGLVMGMGMGVGMAALGCVG